MTTRDQRILPIPHVPTVKAIAVGEQKIGGTTRPLTMTCQYVNHDGKSIYSDYVVKLRQSIRLDIRGLAREVFAGLLGQTLGLRIPPMAIVEIPSDLHNHVTDQDIAKRLAQSPGLNFGSEQLTQGVIPVYVTKELLPDAASVFAFDMFIQNPDRRPEKPNLFQTTDGFILFDHELALPFGSPKMLLGEFPEPWEIDKLAPRGHLFYRHLKEKDMPFDEFQGKLALLQSSTIDQINEMIPAEWQTAEQEAIKSYLLRSCDRREQFKRGLQEVLR